MPRELPSYAQIERLFADPSMPSVMTARQIAEALGVRASGRPALRRWLRELVDQQRLVAVRGRGFAPTRLMGDAVGRFSRHRQGFGFVVPDDPLQSDVFIPPGAAGGALHGDIVATRVVDVQPDGRREGRIVRIVDRRSDRITGLFHPSSSGGGRVEPLDEGFGIEIKVPREGRAGARAGEVVRVELGPLPASRSGAPLRGSIVERLGWLDEPGVEVEVLIRKYDLSPTFPEAVVEEVDALPGSPAGWPLSSREDFTNDTVVTIDGETAKDFDDAISVQRLEDGGYRLHVHIADVAFFVREESAIDEEAARRATSVYFPGRAVPMLPERLSNDLCSLRPRQLRLTQGVSLEFDDEGRLTYWRCHDGLIRSRARLTYTEVAAVVEQRDRSARQRRRFLVPMLDTAHELASKLAERRHSRGAIDFDLPEPEVLLALTGETQQIVARQRNAAHRMIEEFMIAANAAVATELVQARAACLYRAHERPDVDRVARLAEMLQGLGYRVPEPYQALAPEDFAHLLRLVAGRPEEPCVVRLVLRTMSLARYDPECLGHYALALPRYLHFTSPIRRYPDLVVHRALRRLRAGHRELPGSAEDRAARMPEMARECSRLERDAEAAEREALSWKTATFMSQRLGEEYAGRIVEIAPHGLVVLLDEPYVEGLIPVRRLGEEYFRYDAKRRKMTGSKSGATFRLGQEVRVRVDRVDLLRHFVDFTLVGDENAEDRGRRSRRQRPPSAGPKRRSGRGRRKAIRPRRRR
ncbi:MAG: ribonuclease R [Acidobacteriota bacterium]|nr:MAG: ribonuclease R [Acidobacteriota bacterium]